ncbi:MAG: thioredoxin family protein [Dorea formicigenerans]
MNIKVIGSGCENCDKTNAIIAECVEELFCEGMCRT